MQDNIQNNWRESLENADHFPGEILHNKNEAWDELYTRLHSERPYKITRWYWVAAALLLAVAITALLFMKKEKPEPGLVTMGTLPRNKQVTEVARQSIFAGDDHEKPVFVPKQKGKFATASLPGKNSAVKSIEPVTDVSTIDSTSNPPNQTVITSIPHFDSAIIATVPSTPAKKKLRVVHLNEIGQPVEESTVNKYSGRHGFELRIINNEVYNPSATPVSNGLILFKSRITSN